MNPKTKIVEIKLMKKEFMKKDIDLDIIKSKSRLMGAIRWKFDPL